MKGDVTARPQTFVVWPSAYQKERVAWNVKGMSRRARTTCWGRLRRVFYNKEVGGILNEERSIFLVVVLVVAVAGYAEDVPSSIVAKSWGLLVLLLRGRWWWD